MSNLDILNYELIEFKSVSQVVRREFGGNSFFVEYESVAGDLDYMEFKTRKEATGFIMQHSNLTVVNI